MIDALLEALTLSPDNLPLRLQVAQLLEGANRWSEAAAQYEEVLQQEHGHRGAQTGLARSFYHQKKWSAAVVTFEGVQEELEEADDLLYIKALLHTGSTAMAQERYSALLRQNPRLQDGEIDAQLRVSGSGGESGFEEEWEGMGDDAYFLQKPEQKFADVGGMQRVKEEISIKIIQPLRNPDLFKAFGKKAGGGLLMYGPPGCGKTYIAKATAGEIDAKFISIGLHDILDMWMGNSEKNLHEIFEVARRNAPCVLFFDEVDALGASRSDLKGSGMRHLINQFLSELDGVESDNDGLLILAATNAPWSVDAAFRRPGRFDRVLFVEPPDALAREEILASHLHGKPITEIAMRKIADATEGYSGADLKAVIDIAVEEKLRQSMAQGKLLPIETKDLLAGVKAHRPTTGEWFSTARNYALYSNESGLYDDILRYLKIKKG